MKHNKYINLNEVQLNKQYKENYKKYKEKLISNIKKLKKEIDLYRNIIEILEKDNKNYRIEINDNIDNIKEEIKQLLINTLPHGSGIDCDWEFIFHNNGNIDCKNSFHVINNNGYYVKWISITIKFYRFKRNIYHKYGIKDKIKYQIIEKKDELYYKIFAPSNDYYVCNLDDYIYQCMYDFNIILKWQYKEIKLENLKKPFIIK